MINRKLVQKAQGTDLEPPFIGDSHYCEFPIVRMCSCCTETLTLLIHELVRASSKLPEVSEQFSNSVFLTSMLDFGISVVAEESPKSGNSKQTKQPGLDHSSFKLDSLGFAVLAIAKNNANAVDSVLDHIYKQTAAAIAKPCTLYQSNWLVGSFCLLSELTSSLLISITNFEMQPQQGRV